MVTQHRSDCIASAGRALYVSTPDVFSSCKLNRAFGVPTSSVFSYYVGIFVNYAETQKKVVARIAKAELSILSFGVFFRVISILAVKDLSFNRLMGE